MSPVKKQTKKQPRKSDASTLYEVRRSRIQGRGAFAVQPIRKGQRVDEYLGERITHEEADRRYDDSNGRHHTFLFVLDDDTVIDARKNGNNARFINHSCEPNCETIIDGDHIYIKAMKAIAPGEELVYDYRFEWQDEYEPEDVRYYACRCGSKKCRGTILRVPAYLRPTVREWLAGNDVKRPRKPARKRSGGPGPTGRVSGKRAYSGKVISVDLDKVRFPDGSTGTLEMVRHPGASAVVPVLGPLTADPEILLIRQYRYAAEGYLYEVPAGRLDAGEKPDQCAHRELTEETGYTAAKVDHLFTMYTTPGFTDEKIHLFLATGLTSGEAHREADEFVELAPMKLSQALDLIEKGQIQDAKTALALFYTASFRIS